MTVFVLSKSQNLSRSWSSTDIVDALCQAGCSAVEVSVDANLSRGDVALVLGSGSWMSPAVEGFLRRAGAQGATRILWQLEPLLPPASSVATARILERPLGALDSIHGAAGDWAQSLQSWLTCQRLAWANRTEPWSQRTSSGSVFKYPLQQTRSLLASLRFGLIDCPFVSLAPRQKFLEQRGIRSNFVPFGYVPKLGRWLGSEQRDIDVLFLGRLSSRRRSLIRRIEMGLSRAGFALRVVNRDCYGEERTQLLNRTKIILNLHKFPWEFPGIRLLMGMSCKALVVSEPAPDTRPYVNGQHVVVEPIGGVVEALIRYLRDDCARHAITERAHQFATEEMALGKVLSRAISNVSSKVGVQ